MKNKQLYNLNFKELLGYEGEVASTNREAFKCDSYCISCEKNGLCKKIDGELFQMSHGADTTDFEECLGELSGGKLFNHPVMFILESPGGDYGNGRMIEYEGVMKYPSVNVYYWVADHLKKFGKWPNESDLSTDLYGPYFAYLINKYKLKNVYITNLVKCSRKKSTDESFSFLDYSNTNERKLIENFSNLFLKREIQIHQPVAIFCFGDRTTDILMNLNIHYKYAFPWESQGPYLKKLYHPSARLSKKQFIEKNNIIMEETLDEIKHYN